MPDATVASWGSMNSSSCLNSSRVGSLSETDVLLSKDQFHFIIAKVSI